MNDLTTWITGLMRENYDAVGFIPKPAIKFQYIKNSRYVLQRDEKGKRIGYLLHGKIQPGCSVVISQHCIQYEKRLRGYGEKAFRTLLERAQRTGASSIRLRCADDLPALLFWQSAGFKIVNVISGGKRRKRMIVCMVYRLNLPLLSGHNKAAEAYFDPPRPLI